VKPFVANRVRAASFEPTLVGRGRGDANKQRDRDDCRIRLAAVDPGRVEVLGSATDPDEAVEALTSSSPDVCFLDIHMPRLNGFEVLARLPSQPVVVFTTAHDQYALEAFAVNSVDYLLKPVDPAHLDRALGRVERLRSRVDLSTPDLQGLLRSLAESLRGSRPEYPERLASRLGIACGSSISRR
jgi:two-component system LytT family response regulator